MDSKRLSETKGLLKKRTSVDRSKPMVDDAAHPGSGSVLRAISVGHFGLKHTEVAHDGSAPMLEAGTGFHTDIRPAVFAEVQQAKRNSLKPTKSNDRSEPVIEKWVHVETQKPTPRKSVVDELKEKKGAIEALHTYNEHHTVSEIEKYTKPDLMQELKGYKSYIEEKNDYAAKTSKAEAAKKVNNPLVDEIKKKRPSIQEFTAYAAANQSTDTYRSQANPSLVKEIAEKRASIDMLTKSASKKLVDVA